MKQLFIIFIATCFIACTADEDESFKMSSCETSVVKETQEDVQEVANQVNQFILDKFSTNTRGVDGEELYPDFMVALLLMKMVHLPYSFQETLQVP